MKSEASASPPLGQGLMQAQTDIMGTFKLADVIKSMPPYEGSVTGLYEFINNVEDMLMLIRGADQTPNGLLALRAIRKGADTMEPSNTGQLVDLNVVTMDRYRIKPTNFKKVLRTDHLNVEEREA
ncbi:hypothetical protein ACLKA7_001951 [Drosophila subpalustris]